MTGILLTQSSTFIIGQVAWALGKLMDGIFVMMNSLFGIQNIGISIIIFTIVIYTLMVPLTIKQQKFSKLSAIMNPEIQAIQKKYKGKKDQASMLKQQEETKVVYEKYGTSPTGGCLQVFIQMPILFGLYSVIRNIPAYVTSIKESYMPLVNEIIANDTYRTKMEIIGTESPVLMDPAKFDYSQVETVIDALYKFQTSTWDVLKLSIPDLSEVINTTQQGIENFSSFLGINIANSPMSIINENLGTNTALVLVAVMIPLLSGASQSMNLKISQSSQNMDPDNPMAASLTTMNKVMPIMSMFFCLTLPAGLGIYWIVSAVVRTVQQVAINKYLSNVSVEDMISKNQEVAAKKREKNGVKSSKLNEMAQKNVKKINDASEAKSVKGGANAKPGSLAAKANMLKGTDENN